MQRRRTYNKQQSSLYEMEARTKQSIVLLIVATVQQQQSNRAAEEQQHFIAGSNLRF